MTNSQLMSSGLSPVPASFDSVLDAYSQSWKAFERAEKALTAEAQHPDNFNGRGALTARGLRIIRKLFTKGLSDSDIADLMDMNVSSVFRRRREWDAN